MGNRWHLWDSGAGKPDQLTLVLPGGHGVTQCKMCNAHQEEGLALSFPRPVLTTALGHHSPLCSTSSFKFSSCPCISQDTDTQQLREGWQGCSPEKQQVIGTGTVPPAQQCLDFGLVPLSKGTDHKAQAGPGLGLVHTHFSLLWHSNRAQVPAHTNQKHRAALNKIWTPALPKMALWSICGRLKLSVQGTLWLRKESLTNPDSYRATPESRWMACCLSGNSVST